MDEKEKKPDPKVAAAKKAKERLVKIAESSPARQDFGARLDRLEAIIQLSR